MSWRILLEATPKLRSMSGALCTSLTCVGEPQSPAFSRETVNDADFECLLSRSQAATKIRYAHSPGARKLDCECTQSSLRLRCTFALRYHHTPTTAGSSSDVSLRALIHSSAKKKTPSHFKPLASSPKQRNVVSRAK